MATIPDGIYYIVNGYAPTLYMDSVHGNRNNGANLRVWTKDATDNQVWRVSTRSDGSRQITSRFTGKSIDVQSAQITTVGANVQMYTDNDSRAQKWDITAISGRTITVGGTSYQLYKITLTAAPSMCAELYGDAPFSAGANVCIAGYGGSADMLWAFIPVPRIESGGIYNLALRLDPRYGLDVHSGSTANGANVILTGLSQNQNDHKFYLTQRSNGHWVLMNVASKKYVQVKDGKAADMQNVQQWELSNTLREEWKLVDFGDVSYGGHSYPCVKLYSYVDNGGNTYVMDADQNKKIDLGNICIVHTDPDDQGQFSQQWLLMPTVATDPSIPIPANLGWVASLNDTTSGIDMITKERLYPTWTCTDVWATQGPNHYMWRYRSRYLNASTSTYGDWTNWTSWQTALVTIKGQRAWVTEGLPATYDKTLYKALQYQYEVKAVGVGELSRLEGKAASVMVRSIYKPDVVISNAGFGPNGLRVDVDSDYTHGTNTIGFYSITRNGKELLKGPHKNGSYSIKGLDSSTSVNIPIEYLSDWIEDGDVLTFKYNVGNDVIPTFYGGITETLTVSYDAGSGATLSPTVTMGSGRRLEVTLNSSLPAQKVYLRTKQGDIFEGKKDGGKFYIEYPFGLPFDLFAVAVSADSDRWDLWHKTYSEHDQLMRDYPPCHAWSWDGGYFLLECSTDPMVTDRTMSAIYEADALNKRDFQSVYFAHTIQSEYAAEGLLYEGLTESVKSQAEAMLRAQHVRYRAPSGEIADVAVTDVAYQTHREYTLVSVNMIEETL